MREDYEEGKPERVGDMIKRIGKKKKRERTGKKQRSLKTQRRQEVTACNRRGTTSLQGLRCTNNSLPLCREESVYGGTRFVIFRDM